MRPVATTSALIGRCRPLPQSEGYTCLHVAARAGHIHVIRFVLRSPFADLNVNPQDREGWSPLHHSSKAGHLAAVRMLVQNGADPHRRSVRAQGARRRPTRWLRFKHGALLAGSRAAGGRARLCDGPRLTLAVPHS